MPGARLLWTAQRSHLKVQRSAARVYVPVPEVVDVRLATTVSAASVGRADFHGLEFHVCGPLDVRHAPRVHDPADKGQVLGYLAAH